MKIRLLCIGQKMPKWVDEGYNEFSKRMSGDCQLQLIELPMAKRQKNSSTTKLKQKEAQTLIDALKPREHLVVLDVLGKAVDTQQLTSCIKRWQTLGSDVAIIIGGPDGLDKQILSMAKETLSLSRLTLPHPLVRVLLAEQLYRAWSINKGHPYHK